MSRWGEGTAGARRRYTAGALFCGMGGFASGMRRAGFVLRWANDADAAACATFRHRFGGVPVVEKDIGDLSVEGDQLEPVDILTAGFPCQSFSQAGDRRGFDDPRGRTFLEIIRLVGEFLEARRPRILLFENVPHLLHGAGGAWFDRVRRELRRAGYWFRQSACWVANVKDETELPQDRERLFMAAASRFHFSYNPFTPPSPPSARVRSGLSAMRVGTHRLDEFVDRGSRREPSEYLSPHNRYFKMISRKMDSSDRRNIYQLRRSYVREKKDGLCPTLTANMGIGGHNVPFVQDRWGIRRLGVDEIARLQGIRNPDGVFPDDVKVSERYRLLGNAVCADLAALVADRCMDIMVEHCSQTGRRGPT